MSAKGRFVTLGVFVIITIALVITGIILLSAGVLGGNVVLLETYLEESVQGLSVGSAVRRRGVEIGRVEEITFVAREYGYKSDIAAESHLVMVVMSIDRADFPVRTRQEMRTRLEEQVRRGLRFQLASQGVTGIRYLEADMVDPEKYPDAGPAWRPDHLYVPSVPSTLISFTQSVDRILAAIEGVDFAGITRELREAVDTLGKAVTDMKVAEVQKEFVGLVKDLRTTTQLVTALLDKSKAPANAAVTVDLAKVMQSLDEILQSLDREVDGAKVAELRKGVADLVAEVRQTNQSVKSLVDESRNQLKTADIPKRMARLDKTLKRLERLAASQQSDIEAILDNFRQVSANLLKVSETAKKYPSHLLFGDPPPRKETKE